MKKVYTSPHRDYRRHAAREDEISFRIMEAESDLWITVVRAADSPALRALAASVLRETRSVIAGWIHGDAEFGHSLTPVTVPESAPDIIRNMADAARLMGVGPMACVAGAVAGAIAKRLAMESPECLVENGGDTMLYSTRERVAALLGNPETGAQLGLVLRPEDFPLSLCASSAFIGHSLSLGKGDLAVARAKDPCLADAAATAYCNMLKKPADVRKAAARAERESQAPEAIDGIFVQCGDAMALWGAMELTPLA
ncbi:UPF0280 family protein [Desulfovibrio sp. OttesenSCG-928-I05]|nr:UPF0280 family protein [Desulfovibrio sp. OttesenSCG-928-I05]